MRARIAVLAVSIAALSGCVSQNAMYAWGRYDEALYKHYREPQDREAWVTNLKAIILEAEQEGKKVPPGLYAEYGHALLEEQQYDAAISYFNKEKEKWPESRLLMEKMIHNADRLAGRAPPPAPGPAGTLEKATAVKQKAPAAKKTPAAQEKKP
jgi:hypothetical protein